MKRNSTEHLRVKRVAQAVSLALATLVSTTAVAQTATTQQAATPVAEGELATVLIVGARASAQSAISRKKTADTAQDSIIAEDVGAFPDRNVADAISRVAGVAVDRGDFGEGVSISIRGNGADLTRVELDGQGVQQAGGTNMLGGFGAGSDGGRGVEMRQLSSDLIKSVDVVKGSTADMTEGSLGGSVIIKTRTGLDFKKDYFSMRVAASAGSINKEVKPDLNAVWSKKFFNDRLGVLVNVSKFSAANEKHAITQGGVGNVGGPARLLDWDNSPEKTFSFQPQTIRDTPQATDPWFSSTKTAAAGGGLFPHASPSELVTKSAAAKTKADCYNAFPLLTPAVANTLNPGVNRTNAINQRQNELLTCLGQWNDWSPNQVRHFVDRQEDNRWSGDVRLDFKVTDRLTVYAKHSASEGKVNHSAQSMSLGGIGIGNNFTGYGPNGYVGPTYTETIFATPRADGLAGTRAGIPASGVAFFNNLVYRNNGAVTGTVANVVPGSVKVDSNHFVTSADLTDGFYGIEGTTWEMKTESKYTQAGGTYRNGGFKAEFLAGDSSSKFYRFEKRASLGFGFGRNSIEILPNGLWGQTLADGTAFDPMDTSKYYALFPQAAAAGVPAGVNVPVAIPAYTAAQRPLVNSSSTLPFQNARTSETREKTAKIDMSYAVNTDRLPFISALKGGFNLRDTSMKFWGGGGYNVQDAVGTFGSASYVPGIYVPNVNMRTSIQVCQDTPGSLAPGGQRCAYGYNPSTNPNQALQGAIVLTPAQYEAAVKEAVTLKPWSQFYGSDPNRPEGLTEGWTGIDIEKYYKAIGVQNYDLACIKSCKGSDGKVYDQPLNAVTEKVNAAYLMTNFEFDRVPYTKWTFPFGMVVDGNFGYRMVQTTVRGTGLLQFTSIKTLPGYDPLTRDDPAYLSYRTYRKSTPIEAKSTDYMPSLNVNLWAIPDKLVLRYNQAKTIARPGAGRLIPGGSCTYDERFIGETDADGTERDQGCGGIMGNPGVRSLTNRNKNLSLEWYVNKDTVFSASTYKQIGIIGAPTLDETVTERLFAGSDVIDEQTGNALSDLEFRYRRYINQLPFTRKGFEIGSKTAFTFLPWYLRYTGLDANFTKNKSALTGTTVVRDLLTGETMPVAGEPKHSYNWSLWYDDGALSARFAVQVVAEVFNCISGCGGGGIRNYPAYGVNNVLSPAYNPGPPNYKQATRYIDAKIGYKFRKNWEIFAEGRNLGRTRNRATTGPFANFADGTQNVYTDYYSGAKVMVGLNFKTQ